MSKKAFKEGYKYAADLTALKASGDQAEQYITNVSEAIKNLEKGINEYEGNKLATSALKGFIAEEWHEKTYRINAALEDINPNISRLNSNEYASADLINAKTGESFGLKYYKTGEDSALQQSVNHFQRWSALKDGSTFEDFLSRNNISTDDALKSIYDGQQRVIPVDQIKEAQDWLRRQIAKEAQNRPDQVIRYQDTLDHLTDRVESEGIKSIPLSLQKSEEIARLAKEGKFSAEDFNLTTEELVKIEHILSQSHAAGLAALEITAALTIAPIILGCLKDLASSKKIDIEHIKRSGSEALSTSAESYLRGAVVGALTASAHAGQLGDALVSLDPSLIGALTVIVFKAIKLSFSCTTEKISKQEMADEMLKMVFLTSCAFVGGKIGGAITLALLPTFPVLIPIGHAIGSLVGSIFGYATYPIIKNVYLSLAVTKGWSYFGLVEQDYTLPPEILNQMNIAQLEYQKLNVKTLKLQTLELQTLKTNKLQLQRLPFFVMERGLIDLNKVGYILR